jgi:arginine decarboxylase
MDSWSVSDSLDLYNVPAWGSGFFTADKSGHVLVQPKRENGATIDLKELVDDLRRRGYELPLLLRFGDILHSRIEELTGCIRKAIQTYEYGGEYRSIYPIKVNQQRHVVQELLKWGRPFHLGLEVGSKPEMLIALASRSTPTTSSRPSRTTPRRSSSATDTRTRSTCRRRSWRRSSGARPSWSWTATASWT